MRRFALVLAISVLLPLAAHAATAADESMIATLRAQVQQLLTQIQQLQVAQNTPSASSVSTATACQLPLRNLQRGASDSVTSGEVSILQRYLQGTGDYTYGEITGYFGPATEMAVQRFQVAYGVVSSGTPDTTGYGSVGPRTRAAMRCTEGGQPAAFGTPNSSGASVSSGGTTQDTRGSGTTPAPIVVPGGVVCAQPPMPTCAPGLSCVQVLPSAQTYQSYSVATQAGATVLHDGACACGDNGIVCPAVQQQAACMFDGKSVVHGSSITAYQAATVLYGAQCVSEQRTCSNGALSGSYQYTSCVVQGAPTVTRTNQHLALAGNNIYSPDVVSQSGLRYVYFGGWMNNGQIHDNIYRAQCGNLGDNCSTPQAVLDSNALGFEHLNDPSVVKMPGGYYIMYMTSLGAGLDGFVASNNKISYSTSWANDGANWSAPTLVIGDAWLPSATLGPTGKVELFANETLVHGNVVRYMLGTSGTQPQQWEPLVFSNGGFYLNPDVEYRPTIGLYQMFAERQDTKAIDYFTSADGVHFDLKVPNVVTSVSAGTSFVRTPGQDSETAQWLYYAGTNNPSATENKIYFQSWK